MVYGVELHVFFFHALKKIIAFDICFIQSLTIFILKRAVLNIFFLNIHATIRNNLQFDLKIVFVFIFSVS